MFIIDHGAQSIIILLMGVLICISLVLVSAQICTCYPFEHKYM